MTHCVAVCTPHRHESRPRIHPCGAIVVDTDRGSYAIEDHPRRSRNTIVGSDEEADWGGGASILAGEISSGPIHNSVEQPSKCGQSLVIDISRVEMEMRPCAGGSNNRCDETTEAKRHGIVDSLEQRRQRMNAEFDRPDIIFPCGEDRLDPVAELS